MIKHIEISDAQLYGLIRRKEIRFGGNQKLKIYGTLRCTSGRRMKNGKRIFFLSAENAVLNGYRPCGHCMKEAYKKWKDGTV